ncbi:uncharacterized protein LOC143560609 [Bidens hawaiensis]|uniref:uncharacterized protein LOC143560609 n=1 Tax=Bidens hawaiensis TaxID=980011 RepID=UPI00404AC1BA
MVETVDSSTSNNKNTQPLHPAYTVTNINNKIRTLDGKKVTYSSWVKLFKLHARAYKVLNRIDGSETPPETDSTYSAWSELDALILQWIFSTLSDDLLPRVLDTDLTARSAWLKTQEFFINNIHARAVTLETKFTNTALSSCSSFDDYCQTLKDIAEQLRDLDQPVSESRLVIQMVRGLPIEYDTIAAIINQSKPTWDVARGMIEYEQNRKSARSNNNHDTVLLHSGAPPSTDSVRSPYPNGYRGKHYDPAKAARGRGQAARGGRQMGSRPTVSNAGRGPNSNTNGGPNSWGQTQFHQPNMGFSQQAQPTVGFSQQPYTQTPWTPPPTPYPSQPAHYNQHHQAHLAQQPSNPPPGFGPTNGNVLCPSDIGVALSNLSLNYNDPQWNMDMGASSHITSDPGNISSPCLLPPGPIFVGNGQILPVNGSGNGLYTLPNRTYKLNNIVHSPCVTKDLLYVRKFTIDNQVSVEFDPFGFSLKDLKDGHLLSRHNSSGDLYPFTKPEFTLLSSTTHPPWHDRLEHPGANVLSYLNRHFNVCNKTVDSSICSSCQLSNSKRLPFVDFVSTTFKPFDIVHCDLWTSPVISNSGYKDYMVLIDNYTHYVWVYPLKYKSDTFAKFHKLIQTQFNLPIKTF